MRTNSFFTLFMLLSVLSITGTSCVRDLICIDGKGPVETREIILPTITGISLEEGARVYIHQGQTQQIMATGKQNILDRLREDVNGGIWEIDLGKNCFNDLDLTIEITVPDIRKLSIPGSGSIVVNDFTDQDNLDIVISGSGYIRLNEMTGTPDVDVLISGSGEIYASGSFPDLESLKVLISGSGKFNGYMMETATCDVTVSGSGDVYTRVNDQLNVLISGSGDVHYKGFPTVDATITGSGKVINEN